MADVEGDEVAVANGVRKFLEQSGAIVIVVPTQPDELALADFYDRVGFRQDSYAPGTRSLAATDLPLTAQVISSVRDLGAVRQGVEAP